MYKIYTRMLKSGWWDYTCILFSSLCLPEYSNEFVFCHIWKLDLKLEKKIRKRKTNTMWYHLYVESKIWHKWSYLWNRNWITDIENRMVVAKEEGIGGGMEWEFGVSRRKLLYIEWINNKVLLYSTENYIQYPMINHNGKEYIKKCIYMYYWITLLYSSN